MQQKSLFSYFWECLTKKYCSVSGRARRTEYWGFMLFSYLIIYTIPLLFALCNNIGEILSDPKPADYIDSANLAGPIVSVIMVVVFLLPNLGVTIRRLHDTGRSGWYILPTYVLPIIIVGLIIAKFFTTFMDSYEMYSWLVNILFVIVWIALVGYSIFFFVLMCLPGKPGVNKYGPNPKEEEIQNFI